MNALLIYFLYNKTIEYNITQVTFTNLKLVGTLS